VDESHGAQKYTKSNEKVYLAIKYLPKQSGNYSKNINKPIS
jgi:hypothetical protein